MELTPKKYTPRLIDATVARYLKLFGALSLEGPKWCGKTWTGLNHAKSVVYLNDTSNNFRDRRYAQMDVNIILDREAPELIDEWQEVPAIWDAVRFKCDQDRRNGKYILTGSATPVTQEMHHSGAGRICRINMRTMTLQETGDSTGQVRLGDLFKGRLKAQEVPAVSIRKLAYYIVRGGWPANVGVSERDAGVLPGSYLDDVLRHDITAIDGVARSSERMLMLMRSLARNESSTASLAKIVADISEGEAPAKNTVAEYMEVLNQLYMLDNQVAYSENIRSRERVGKAVKRHFTDVSLACAALGMGVDRLMEDLNTFGLYFEALVEHDLRVYVETLGGRLYHYRHNDSGMEVDAIVELGSGVFGAVEIKLGTDQEDAAAANLRKFAEGCTVAPAFLAVITGLGEVAIRRPDGVMTVPFCGLGI